VRKDLFAVSVSALIDQALYSATELEHVPDVQAALRAIGEDPAAMSAALRSSANAARDAQVARATLARGGFGLTQRVAALTQAAAAWIVSLRAGLRLTPGHEVAVRRVLATLPRFRRRLVTLHAAVRDATRALASEPALVAAHPACQLLADQGRDLLARLDAHALAAADHDRAGDAASDALAAARAALAQTLRHHRATWQAAARLHDVRPAAPDLWLLGGLRSATDPAAAPGLTATPPDLTAAGDLLAPHADVAPAPRDLTADAPPTAPAPPPTADLHVAPCEDGGLAVAVEVRVRA
jgi:hypothetical protein